MNVNLKMVWQIIGVIHFIDYTFAKYVHELALIFDFAYLCSFLIHLKDTMEK